MSRLLAFVLLILLLPVYCIIAISILIESGNPVIFSQKRAGKQGRIFKIYKFRTMLPPSNTQQETDPQLNYQRITHLGHVLRKYHLDELPQLFHICNGEMAFIGPRPLLPEYLAYYTPEQNKRHEVLPGITGLSQIKTNATDDWYFRLKWDVIYVNKKSLKLNVYILIKTLKKIFFQSNIETPQSFQRFNT